MPHYEVTRKTWLNTDHGPVLFKPGKKIEFGGWPNAALLPLDDDGKALQDYVRAQQGLGKKARKLGDPSEFLAKKTKAS